MSHSHTFRPKLSVAQTRFNGYVNQSRNSKCSLDIDEIWKVYRYSNDLICQQNGNKKINTT